MKHRNDIDFNARLYGKQKFGFRKLSVGLAAVALGTTFLMTNGELVHADITDVQTQKDAQIEEVEDNQTDNFSSTNINQADSYTNANKDQNDTSNRKSVPLASTIDADKSSDTSTKNHQTSNNTESKEQSSNILTKNSKNNVKDSDNEKTASGANSNKYKQLLKDKDNNGKNIQTVEFYNLKTGNLSAEQLKEDKKVEENAQMTVTVDNKFSGNVGEKMAGSNGTILNIQVSGSHTFKPGESFHLQIGPNDSTNLFAWDSDNWKVGTSKELTNYEDPSKNYEALNNGNGLFTFTLKTPITTKQSGTFTIKFTPTIIGDRNKVTKRKLNVPIPISFTSNIDSSLNLTNNSFTVDLVPYSNKVNKDEIAYGFANNLHPTIASEAQHGEWENGIMKHTINDDLPDNLKNSNRQVMQYGTYFNYGNRANNTKLNPLSDVIFDQIFSQNQLLLPHSIKVWEVPDKWAVDSNGNRHEANDVDPDDPQGRTYYQEITNQAEDTDFENYLRDHMVVKDSSTGEEKPWITPISDIASENFNLQTGFHFDQTKPGQIGVPFKITPGDNRKNHAYYIQVDTLIPPIMPKNWGDGTGPTVSTKTGYKINGTGTEIFPSTSHAFQGIGISSYNSELNAENANAGIYFQDITNPTKLVNLDKFSGYDTDTLYKGDPNKAIPFNSLSSIEKAIKNITKDGNYKLVSMIPTKHTYDASSVDLQKGSTLLEFKFGNFKKDTTKYFTLNFVKVKPQVQTKSVSYEINYVYENGTQKNVTPTPISGSINFESKNGTTWTIKDHDGNSYNIPNLVKVADKYKKSDNITLKVTNTNGNLINSYASLTNNKTKFTVSNTIPDGTKIIINVPYYALEHADVRFVDDDDNGSETGILNYLKSQNIDLITETFDKKGHGLSDDYTNEDDNSSKKRISFDNLSNIMNTLLDHKYTYNSVDGGAITNNHGKSFTFPAFDDIETSDQHFVIHLGHSTKQETKTIDETINYVDEDNNSSLLGQSKQISLTFTKTTDLVDDTKSTPWTFNGMFNEVDNPTFKNYKIDPDASKITEVLNYTKDNKATSKKSTLAPTSKDSVGAVSFTPELVAKLPDEASHLVITIPYKHLENIHIHYIDEDNNGQEINNTTNSKADNTKLFNGVSNQLAGASNINNNTPDSIKYLESLGYIFDEDATNGKTSKHGNFDTSKNNFKENTGTKNTYNGKLTVDLTSDPDDQNYYVYLYHNIQHDLEEKTITENIKYIDEATGQEIHDQYHSGTLTFTRNIYTDKVTGAKQISNWSLVEFKPVENPTIPGYTIDPDKIAQKLNNTASSLAKTDAKEIGSINFEGLSQDQITALPTGSHIDFVVPYVKNVTPPTPEPTQPIPSQPTSPTKPTPTPSNPTQPTQASQPTSPAKPKTPKTPKNTHHKTRTPKKPNTKKHTTSTFNPRNQRENHHKTTNTVPSKGQNISVPTKNQHIPTPKSETMKNNVKNTNSNIPTLPQTGEKQNKALTFGFGILALSALLGLAGYRKRKDN